MDNRQIAELISERIGPRPVPFEAVRTLALEIYHDLGGREDDENFADIFEILLSILPLTNLIDDTSIYLDKTWSSYKIDASLNQVITRVEDLMNFDCSTIEPTTTNFVPGTEYTVHEALQRTANLFGGFQDEIDDINALIPGQATKSNQLADKSFVNSTVATNAANFRGNWTNWTAVPSNATLYPEDYVGNRTPTNNDYMMVQDASDYEGLKGSWRFIYVGDWNTTGKSGWNPQYKVGSTFTAVQQAAIDSGITATKVATYDGYGTSITALQTDKLDKVNTANKIYGTDLLGQQISYVAGTGISFENGKISNTNTKAVWGNITGTISNQTDLSTALDSKQDVLTAGNNITINGTTISAKDTTYSASDNIDITNNAIKAVGYRYDTTNGAFAEGDRDIVKDGTTYLKSTATGRMSHAEGNNTTASGTASHAEGRDTTASVEASHAEGYKTTASGYYSHAEGSETTASVEASHAEGFKTVASGVRSHAEGYQTTASGTASHAEGYRNTVVGEMSHVEGGDNKIYSKYGHAEGASNTIGEEGADGSSKGYKSHAEGSGNTVTGNGSHAEGVSNTVSSNNAHAEGQANVVNGVNAHAEGKSNKSIGLQSHAEGQETQAIGDNSHSEGLQTVASGQKSHAEGNNTTASGATSHSEGDNTKAIGTASHTEGNNTKAIGTASHSEGKGYTGTLSAVSTASGNNLILTTISAIMDNLPFTLQVGDIVNYGSNYAKVTTINTSDGSIAITTDKELGVQTGNYINFVKGISYKSNAHSEGYLTAATENYAHSEGYLSLASGTASHAEGNNTTALGNSAHAEGEFSWALVDVAHAEGAETTAKGVYSHAEGYQTYASGEASHAEGKGKTAAFSSVKSVSTEGSNHLYELGTLTTTISNKSYTLQVGNTVNFGQNYAKVTAINNQTITTDKDLVVKAGYTINLVISGSFGDSAHSEGYLTVATGKYSHSEGYYTTASGDYSHAEGYNAIASGHGAHAGGYSFKSVIDASGAGSFAHGHTSNGSISASSKGAVAIGCASGVGAFKGIIKASGLGAHAEGYASRGTIDASGNGAHAEGYNTAALANGAHAEGRNTTASGEYSHAEGFHTEANNQSEHASGKYNKSNKQDANAQTIFSIGIGTSKTDRKNAIEVLRDGRVYITGIGGYDGTNPFDSSSLQDFLNGLSGGGNA